MNEPVEIIRKRRAIDFTQYRFRQAKESDFSELVTCSTVICDADSQRVSVVYLKLDDDCSEITNVLQRIKYDETHRTSGLTSTSRIFGYSPRITIRTDYCKATALSHEDPMAHELITSYAKRVSTYYRQFNPDLYDLHQQQVTKVLEDWKLEDSVFTSGIINKNNPLAYHFDAGNFKNVWSNMLVFKHDVEGGYLAVPEYDMGFEVCNNSLLMFDGQNLLHGVTPIKQCSELSYRYSIVYYSLQQMWNCLPPTEELKRIRKLRTEREEKRATRNQGGNNE